MCELLLMEVFGGVWVVLFNMFGDIEVIEVVGKVFVVWLLGDVDMFVIFEVKVVLFVYVISCELGKFYIVICKI